MKHILASGIHNKFEKYSRAKIKRKCKKEKKNQRRRIW